MEATTERDYTAQEVAERLCDLQNHQDEAVAPYEEFSPSRPGEEEYAVLCAMAKGLVTTRAIGEKLGISEQAVHALVLATLRRRTRGEA